jgi:hypothetical protein
MQTAESSNAALTGSAIIYPTISDGLALPAPTKPCELDTDPASLDTNKKKSSNKPEEQTEKRHKGIERRWIRAKLTRDLWEEYQKPGISTAEKIKLGALLSRLTDKKKAAPKTVFG